MESLPLNEILTVFLTMIVAVPVAPRAKSTQDQVKSGELHIRDDGRPDHR